MMLTIYGIPNCDTVKKARLWLAEAGVAADFHDYRKSGVPDALDEWVSAVGWEVLLNRAGTTFRALPDAEKQGLDAPRALALMRTNPAMIKRPVLGGRNMAGRDVLLVGFKPAAWADALDG